MTSHDELRLDLVVARYLSAVELDDFDVQSEVWQQAATDAALAASLHDLHTGLLEEQTEADAGRAQRRIASAVEATLPSGTVIRPEPGPVTAADVAEELFRSPPGRLSAEAHTLNEKLRTVREPLPAELGVSALTAWAEAVFGPAPSAYWDAFRKAAIKLRLRRSMDIEYQLAARPAPPRPGGKP